MSQDVEHIHTSACAIDRPCPDDLDWNPLRERVLAIHRPSTDHGDGWNPYCVGCWEAGGMDGAPNYPCPTAVAVGVTE